MNDQRAVLAPDEIAAYADLGAKAFLSVVAGVSGSLSGVLPGFTWNHRPPFSGIPAVKTHIILRNPYTNFDLGMLQYESEYLLEGDFYAKEKKELSFRKKNKKHS